MHHTIIFLVKGKWSQCVFHFPLITDKKHANHADMERHTHFPQKASNRLFDLNRRPRCFELTVISENLAACCGRCRLLFLFNNFTVMRKQSITIHLPWSETEAKKPCQGKHIFKKRSFVCQMIMPDRLVQFVYWSAALAFSAPLYSFFLFYK